MGVRFDFAGKRVLVTGASRGIGFAVAEAFAAAGADLVVLAEDEAIRSAAERLSAIAARPVRAVVCDIADRASVAAALADIDRLDVLINNAGLERPTPLTEADTSVDAAFARVMAINVTGTNNVTRALVSRIAEGGRIVVTASIWGKIAVPDFSAYVGSKHALIGMTRVWARELGARRITVNAICPGWVRTEASMRSLSAMAARTGAPEDELLREIVAAQAIGGLMEPVDVTPLYLFLASDAAANITGQAINVDRGEVMA